MKKVFVEVVFIDENNIIKEKNTQLLEQMYFYIINEYVKYINGKIIK